MRFLFLIIFCFTVSRANASDDSCIDVVQKEANQFYHPIDLDSPKNSPACSKKTDKYLNRDFSDLLIPVSDFLGFIGTDYQRLYIKFNSVVQDKNNKKIYHVNGQSKVKENEMNFTGEIEVVEIDVLAPHYEIDDRFQNDGIKMQGILLAKYELREDADKKSSGRFAGKMILRWLVDKDDELQYDVFDGDGSNNNQYSGSWTSYKTKISKVANWGEGRIPNSGDLENSADGFWPNKKYESKGWAGYNYPVVIESKKNKLNRKSFAED